jgi:hypothetical protein
MVMPFRSLQFLAKTSLEEDRIEYEFLNFLSKRLEKIKPFQLLLSKDEIPLL